MLLYIIIIFKSKKAYVELWTHETKSFRHQITSYERVYKVVVVNVTTISAY